VHWNASSPGLEMGLDPQGGVGTMLSELPSGKHTKSYGKWPFIVDLPIKNG
jgi:hypothetical protein